MFDASFLAVEFLGDVGGTPQFAIPFRPIPAHSAAKTSCCGRDSSGYAKRRISRVGVWED